MTDITLVKLHTEGRLRCGDIVSTPRLGQCEVATIHTANTIDVRRLEGGGYFRLSGINFGPDARVVSEAPHPSPGSPAP